MDDTLGGGCGLRLSSLRGARRWSRERLAAEAGVSLATVWRMEHGHYPRVQHLLAIADALGVSTDELLGRTATEAGTGAATRDAPP